MTWFSGEYNSSLKIIYLAYYNFSTQTAEVSGVKLKTGVAVVLCTEDNSNPKFGIIKNLFVVDSELILAMHAWKYWSTVCTTTLGLLKSLTENQ